MAIVRLFARALITWSELNKPKMARNIVVITTHVIISSIRVNPPSREHFMVHIIPLVLIKNDPEGSFLLLVRYSGLVVVDHATGRLH